MMKMTDEEWAEFDVPLMRDGEPVETGDSLVDEWEKQLQGDLSDADEAPWFEQVREVLGDEPT